MRFEVCFSMSLKKLGRKISFLTKRHLEQMYHQLKSVKQFFFLYLQNSTATIKFYVEFVVTKRQDSTMEFTAVRAAR